MGRSGGSRLRWARGRETETEEGRTPGLRTTPPRHHHRTPVLPRPPNTGGHLKYLFMSKTMMCICLKLKQALQSKFLVTAEGQKICCKPLSYDSGCQPVHCTCLLWYYAVKLYFLLIFSINLCLMILMINLNIVLVHCCTMLCTFVLNMLGLS